ncbi:MAG: DEAD/DEAH box helicase [Hyphomonas sp.]|nr:DEAD/DEAH box helicase [Hyphomonas sp.]
MSETVTIAHNAVTAKLYRTSDPVCLEVSNLLSYLVEGYEQMNAYRSGGWDGRSTFFNWKDNTFPRGFVQMVEQKLRGKGYKVQILAKDTPDPLGPEKPEVDAFGYVDRYDYQLKTVEQLVKRGQMIARVATGGGKSRIAKIAHARIGRNTIFITTRKALMYQMKRGFEDSGWECGIIGDGEWEPIENLNVAMVQTLVARLAEPESSDQSAKAMRQRRIRQQTIKFLHTVDFVIGEEAHESGSDSYFEILNHCRNAHYRLALTATPFMRADAEDNMRLMAGFGKIGIDVTEELLIKRGILAKPYFKFVDLPVPKKLRRTTNWQRAIELGIIEHQLRNEDAISRCKRGAEYGLSTMLLVTRKAHGALLEKMAREAGLRVMYIFGESNQKKRDVALEALGSGSIDVLIGSTILDVGVDVPSVGQIGLVGGGKAEVALRQRIGRGLREKKNGPNVVPVWDYKDRGNKHLQSHALMRQKVVKGTPGFAENVIADGKDFDYEDLGFKQLLAA